MRVTIYPSGHVSARQMNPSYLSDLLRRENGKGVPAADPVADIVRPVPGRTFTHSPGIVSRDFVTPLPFSQRSKSDRYEGFICHALTGPDG